ncbi:MAG TPA: radical SAM protein [Candidatus Limnocylindrales bacterium]|nr:radical SAM protein [Candidatus Limnocylindrales bacterium]
MTVAKAPRAALAAMQVIGARLRGRPALVGANLFVTQRCNLRCIYCSSPLRRTPELTTAQWTGIIGELAGLGCRRLTFLGGEPLLRADLAELIASARSHGMSTVVTSNGLLVPHRIDSLREVDTLVLSLDAPGPANDDVRGKGVFAAVESAIEAARVHHLPVKLNAVLSAVTAPHLDELLAFTERHDLCLTINIMRSGAPDLWNDAAKVKDDDEAIGRLCGRLAEVARTNPRLLFSPQTYRYAASWGDYGRDRLEADQIPPEDPRRRDGPTCHAGRAYISIDADGAVFPCTMTFQRIVGGNAATGGVAAAWRALHDHPCVACYSPCMVEQNFLHSLHPPVLAHFARRHFLRFA